METLGKLFGSETKVKIIRLFLFAPDAVFEGATIASKVDEDISKVRRELSILHKIAFLKRRMKKGRACFMLNSNFSYLAPLHTFMTAGKPVSPKEMVKKIVGVGTVKLIVIAGLFIKNPDSRVDLLVVGDNMVKHKLTKVLKHIEAEIGREIRYAYFETSDFLYRIDIYDKLVRDILDYPHEKLVNKLALLD